MTRRRWIADEVSSNHAAITGDHADHLARVLRAQVGQEFDISSQGIVRRGRIVSVTNARIEFELGEEIPPSPASHCTLLLAIFKFDRMEWAIEKCTELGVSRIVPLVARRTDTHLAAASVKRVERWRRIAREASEQSRRISSPEISTPLKFKDALSACSGRRIVLSESEDEIQLWDALERDSSREITLAIGPEGGWTEDELRSFHETGWISASLGPTILRAETAAIAATAIGLSGQSRSLGR
jgi:16S rRNA (uracil1498-N3)-methyltransferase